MAKGEMGVSVHSEDWVLLKGDKVLAASDDIADIMKEYEKHQDDEEVRIVKSLDGDCLFY